MLLRQDFNGFNNQTIIFSGIKHSYFTGCQVNLSNHRRTNTFGTKTGVWGDHMLKTGEMGSWGDLGRFNLKTVVYHTNQESRQVCFMGHYKIRDQSENAVFKSHSRFTEQT